MKHTTIAILAAALISLGTVIRAHALEYVEGADAPTRTVEDYIKDYVDVPKGAMDWKVFGKTKSTEIKSKTDDAYDIIYEKPTFTPEVTALNGKEVKIKGFMFPLDPTDGQKMFLFGPFPVNCPYQYHVGPSLVMEVHVDKKPIKFSYDPIILTGTLELVPNDPEYSTFYRLKNAKQVKE